jgi:hypothetical protein
MHEFSGHPADAEVYWDDPVRSDRDVQTITQAEHDAIFNPDVLTAAEKREEALMRSEFFQQWLEED